MGLDRGHMVCLFSTIRTDGSQIHVSTAKIGRPLSACLWLSFFILLYPYFFQSIRPLTAAAICSPDWWLYRATIANVLWPLIRCTVGKSTPD